MGLDTPGRAAASALIVVMDAEAPAMALEVPRDQTFDEWLAMGRQLAAGSKVVNWWIGDWWAAGSHRYGERARAAADGIFGKEFQTIANAASVCRSFEGSRRREVLSFGHHAEVAALAPEKADEILSEAEREKWSVRDTRRAVLAHKIETGAIQPRVDDDPDHTACRSMAHAWNRGSTEARAMFADLVAESVEAGLGVIDP